MEEEIFLKKGNHSIAEFMGYVHHHPGVDDCSDEFDWRRVEVFSRIPIEVHVSSDGEQVKFAEVPNPDYQSTSEKCVWNREFEKLSWNTLYSDQHLKDELFYHSSWDWLMLVVEKIESIHDEFHGFFGCFISSNCCTIQGTNMRLDPDQARHVFFYESYGKTKIEACFRSVVFFIEWFNQQSFKTNS